ncbi:hypothetical protein EASAB2608_07317 [Streptomyces sp. EAS-AB2608]|nr:hypothetical protein EASAB2608_07317 [Streptomyces sp. EAS-AB2608]
MISDHPAQAPNRTIPAPSETFLRVLKASAPYAPVADPVPVDPTRRPSYPVPRPVAGHGRVPVPAAPPKLGTP